MKKTETIPAIAQFTLPAWNEIPDVGLYLDQVVKYVNTYLAGFEGMEITGSMVSNYVKLKIISKATRKMYSRSQIAQIFFTACAKSVLSMDQIKQAFRIFSESGSEMEHWESFRKGLLDVLSGFRGSSAVKVQLKKNEEERMLQNIDIAIAHKMYLDEYFAQFSGKDGKDGE